MSDSESRSNVVSILLALLILGLLAGGYFLYHEYQRKKIERSTLSLVGNELAKQGVPGELLAEGRTTPVNKARWKELRTGMSESEVSNLLGKPGISFGGGESSLDGRTRKMPKFWAYNWSSGMLATEPHPKAYVVYFDEESKVSRWREPQE